MEGVTPRREGMRGHAPCRGVVWAALHASIAAILGLEAASGEVLYNGIHLQEPWPPRYAPKREPMPVPYLEAPPTTIPIDVGRQLFVDDFLIEETTLTRTYHDAEYYTNNPILRPDQAWEMEGESQGHPSPTAMVFSDGVWYDPLDRQFKMWYMGGYVKRTCHAVSDDGISWRKPSLDVVPGTNIVHTAGRDSCTVWLNLAATNLGERYTMCLYRRPEDSGFCTVYRSADGVHWGKPVTRSGPTGDRSTAFYNPFREVWVYNIRGYTQEVGRFRKYWEGPDPIAGAHWKEGEPQFWVGADSLDPMRSDLNTPCELYNLDCVAYESLVLGLFSIWRGQPLDRAKPNEICVGFSRDGFHWHRPDRTAFIPVSERQGDWNWGNVQSAGGCCLIVGDKLYFYVSGRSGVPGSPSSGTSSTGLAMLRRDGFASMDAGKAGGTLTTRPVTFSGSHLFVNAEAENGEVRAEILDETGAAIPQFELASCEPVRTDATISAVHWGGAADISALRGKAIRFRFHVKNAALYAFWVSPDESGASHGYVGAGGPGFTGPTDTVGAGRATFSP
jgi:hypothetical protein